MRILFNILTAVMLALVTTGCTLRDLSEIEPTRWEKEQFEREVSKAVRRAVNTPGIDNGSTIVVTSSGDTLIAPADSTLAASQIRTVYVDIKSPEYPRGISTRAMEIASIITVIATIAGIIMLILIGVFIVIIRRQHGRNKAINHAIDQGYELPESFFTGMPAAAPVTINQLKEIHHQPADNHTPTDPGCQCPPPPAPGDTAVPPVDTSSFHEVVRSISGITDPKSIKELRNGLIMIGFSVIVFMFFMSVRNEPMAFLCGGSLLILGGAELLTLFFARKIK